jgi:phage shock protein C
LIWPVLAELDIELFVSAEFGASKPDARVYPGLCERLDVDSARAAFVDDRAANARGATDAGLHGHHFTDAMALASCLRSLGLPSTRGGRRIAARTRRSAVGGGVPRALRSGVVRRSSSCSLRRLTEGIGALTAPLERVCRLLTRLHVGVRELRTTVMKWCGWRRPPDIPSGDVRGSPMVSDRPRCEDRTRHVDTTGSTGRRNQPKGTPMSRRDQPLYRDTADQKIGGVCSGLARYFDLDPLLVRVAFVAGLVFSGATLIAYVLLWWLVDPAPAGTWDAEEATPPSRAADSTGETLTPPNADDEAA